MGRKENLNGAKLGINGAIQLLANIKAKDIKNRKSVKKSLKPKYSVDIDLLSGLIGVLIQAKKIVRVIPKAVQ